MLKVYKVVFGGCFLLSLALFLLYSLDSWNGPFGALLPLGCGVVMVPLLMIGMMGIITLVLSVAELLINPPTDPKKLFRLRATVCGMVVYIITVILVIAWRAVAYGPEKTAFEAYMYAMFITPLPLIFFGTVVLLVRGVISIIRWLFR